MSRSVGRRTRSSSSPSAGRDRSRIDGRPAGTSPGEVKLMGFTTLPITVSKAGYKTVTRRFYSKLARDRLFVRLPRR